MVAPPPLRPELRLGDFTLDEKLAVGGMAEIWTAQGPDGEVALKILRPELVGDPTFVAMFEDEVRIATQLRHPNIVEVFGVHEAEGHVLQSMERIEGLDLRRVLSQCARAGTRLPVALCAFVGRELARALAHAHHRKGEDGRPLDIVHRDVSPHNVMVRRDGRVKLLDFGVARAAERAVKTRTGVIKGKLSYMAPEQALAVGVTPQTDIFAAGVVLWEMLTVERLFVADSDVELLERIVAAQVPPVREKNPSVPEDVARLLDQMLAQRAPDRPASMEEVERVLNRVIAVHFVPDAASESALAGWLGGHVPPPPAEAEASDTVSAPGPEVAQDVTATYVRPERQDDTWAGPPPSHLPEDVTPSDPAPTLDPTSVPPALTAPPPDVAKTWVDQPAPDLEAPTPHTAATPDPGETPTPGRRAPDRMRRPTQTEIIRAVESQATVEMEADADVAALAAQFIQVSSPPPAERPAEHTGPSADLTAPPLPAPRSPSPPRAEVPTVLGDLVAPELPAPAPAVADPLPISAKEVSGGFEPIGPGRAPAQPSAPAPVAPAAPTQLPAPPVVARRTLWSWVLPGITLALAGLVLILIFLLIRGQ